MKKIILILIILILTGCSGGRLYSYPNYSIMLDNSFIKGENNTSTVYLESNDIIISALLEKYDDLMEIDINEDTSINNYVLEIQNNLQIKADIIENDNITYFTYEDIYEDISIFNFVVINKTKSGFWSTIFTTPLNNKDKYFNQFIEWSKTIKAK